MKKSENITLVRRIKNTVINQINSYLIFMMWSITVFVDFLILCQAVQHSYSKNPNKWSWFAFSIIHIIMLSWSAFLAIK